MHTISNGTVAIKYWFKLFAFVATNKPNKVKMIEVSAVVIKTIGIVPSPAASASIKDTRMEINAKDTIFAMIYSKTFTGETASAFSTL